MEIKRGPGRPPKSENKSNGKVKGKRGRPKGYSPKVASLGFNDKVLRKTVEEVVKNYFENVKLSVEVKFNHSQRGRKPKALAGG